MSNIETGGPAFPGGEMFTTTDFAGNKQTSSKRPLHFGASLRDYFAAHATEYDIDNYTIGPTRDQVLVRSDGTKAVVASALHRTVAEAKYAYADAMLEARK